MKGLKIFFVLAIALGLASFSFGQSKQTQLTVDQIIAMKKAGVSDDIIKAMINASSESPGARSSTVAATAITSEPGLYAINGGRTVVMASETFRSEDINPAFGLMKAVVGQMKQRAILDGSSASVRLTRTATFFFVGNESPNSLTLVRLEKKSSKRQVTIFKAGPFSRSTGIEDSKKIKFSTDQVAPRRWKLEVSLEPGEYVFFSGSVETKEYVGATLHGKAYTFGVD